MYISKEVDYGLRTMVVIASSALPLTVKEISEKFKIPHNFISLLLPKLKRQNLVVAEKIEKRDVLKLGKPAREITALNILEAINGPVDLIIMNDTNRGDVLGFEALMGVWKGLTGSVEGYLSGITLENLALS